LSVGSIRKAPRSGRWEARYRDQRGRQRTHTFARKVDAQAFLAALETDTRRGQWIDPALGRTLLRDFVEDVFLPTLNGLEPTSRVRDISYLRTHILPVFGDDPLAAIDWPACQAWVNDLAARRAPATVAKAAQIMGKVMKAAVRARVVPYNPMAEVALPRIEESEDVYLTPAQVRDLADAMEQVAPQYRALVYVGCYSGPRIGELAALRWTDIDLLHRTVSITRKVVEVTGLGMVEGGTKTKAGRRSVTIPRLVAAELELHRARFPSSDLVFTAPDGDGPIRANNLRRRAWAAAVKLAGLDPAPTFHDMRHTAVSLWIAAGASDLEVAKWAGHRSVSFTKDRYAHLFPEHGEALADRLDSFIASATPTPAAPAIAIRS
jgi:integrase